MRGITLTILIILSAGLAGCSPGPNVYRNKSFGFSVTLPRGHEKRVVSINKTDIGVELRSDEGFITVQAMATGTAYEDMPFDSYVRIAASVDIQNYERLISIRRVLSDSRVRGYKTFWEVGEVIPPDEWEPGMEPKVTITGPIYYFPVKEPTKLGDQPVKAIMISCYVLSGRVDSPLVKETSEIARSFKYIRKGR